MTLVSEPSLSAMAVERWPSASGLAVISTPSPVRNAAKARQTERAIAEREELMAKQMRKLQNEVAARKRDLVHPNSGRNLCMQDGSMTARGHRPEPLTRSSSHSGAMSARCVATRDPFGHLSFEDGCALGMNTSLGCRPQKYQETQEPPLSARWVQEPPSSARHLHETRRTKPWHPVADELTSSFQFKEQVHVKSDQDVQSFCRFNKYDERPLPERHVPASRLQPACSSSDEHDDFVLGEPRLTQSHKFCEERSEERQRPSSVASAWTESPSAETSPKEMTPESSGAEACITPAMVAQWVKEDSENTSSPEQDACEEEEGLRRSTAEDDRRAAADPLVFGPGFKSAAKGQLSADSEGEACGPWVGCFSMGGQPLPPRKSFPEPRTTKFMAKILTQAPRKSFPASKIDLKFMAKPDIKPAEAKPPQRPDAAKPHSTQPQRDRQAAPQASQRSEAKPSTTQSQRERPAAPQAVQQPAPQAAPQRCESKVHTTRQGHSATLPPGRPQSVPQATAGNSATLPPGKPHSGSTATASQNSATVPPASSARARAFSCPRAGGSSGPQTRAQSPPTAPPQSGNTSPRMGVRPPRQDAPPGAFGNASTRGCSYEIPPGGKAPQSARGCSYEVPPGGKTPHRAPSPPPPSRHSTGGMSGNAGKASGQGQSSRHSTGQVPPRSKPEMGSRRPRPATAGAKDGRPAQGNLLQNLKAQLAKLSRVRNVDERKKLFLKLCFQWHPDKNPSNVEMATKGFQFLQEQKSKVLSA